MSDWRISQMRLSRIACFSVGLVFLLCLIASGRLAAPPAAKMAAAERNPLTAQELSLGARPLLVAAYHGYRNSDTIARSAAKDDHGSGIHEVVPSKYQSRYQE